MLDTLAAPTRSFELTCRGRSFAVFDTPLLRAAAQDFADGRNEGMLQFFDAALPRCGKFVDFGAYVGFTSLYAATQIRSVHAFEVSPTNHALLRANIACNGDLAQRIIVQNLALGDRHGTVEVCGRAVADAGARIASSLHCGSWYGRPEATVAMRAACEIIGEIGVDGGTLLKIDIEGAEYHTVPSIADPLRDTKPFVHLAFHPGNIVVSDDEYVNAVTRLRSALEIAESLAHYRYMYAYTPDGWTCIDPPSRPYFLRQYLLAPKRAPGSATSHYGFVDSIGFSDVLLGELTG